MEKRGDESDPNKDEGDITEDSIDEQEQTTTHPALGNFWYMYQLILIRLELLFGLFWQWLLLLTLADNGNRIFRYFNRNANAKNGNYQLLDTFVSVFVIFATVIILTHTPLDIVNERTHVIVTPNNTHQNLPTNNDINEDATLYSNYNDNTTNVHIDNDYLEPNFQDIIEESVASEAVDDPEYNLNIDDIIEIENKALLNHNSNEESDEITNSDDGFNTENESDSSWDDFDADIIYDNYVEDDSDEMSIISHVTDYTNSIDDGYDTNSDNSDSSEISIGANGEDDLINTRHTSDNGYESNGESSNADERSFVFEITCETNNENYQIDDDDDKWSDISHITYAASSEGDSIPDDDEISTDDGYNTKDENDSLADSDKEDIIIELQYNAPSEQKISTATTSDSAFTIETNADTSIKVELQETIVSINPTYVGSNEANEAKSLPSVVDNSECIRDPSISTEIQEHPHQNHNVDVDNGQFDRVTGDVDRQNVHPIVNNYQQNQPVFSDEVLSDGIQSNAQLNEPTRNDEQTTTQNVASSIRTGSDQSSPIEPKTTDDDESDHEEDPPANRPTSMQFQKQPRSTIEPNAERSKQNAE